MKHGGQRGIRCPPGAGLPARPGLAALLHDLAAAGSQVVVATHSPIIAAIPGAHLLELGSWGTRPAAWEDLSLVIAWRQFMRDPRSYFRHLFEES
jgi:predicted ATPase